MEEWCQIVGEMGIKRHKSDELNVCALKKVNVVATPHLKVPIKKKPFFCFLSRESGLKSFQDYTKGFEKCIKNIGAAWSVSRLRQVKTF